MEENPKFSLLEPLNMNINHPIAFEDKKYYKQLFDIGNFTFLINPPVCQNSTEGLLLLIFVSSNPKNHRNRDLIRKTWGRKTDCTKIVFLMGIPPEDSHLESQTTIAARIQEESVIFGDIVQGTFMDVYRNLSYKHMMGLKWAANHCPAARYVLKTDDDVMVHSEALVNFLVRDLSPWGARRLIICYRHENAIVWREDSKWIVTEKEYPNMYYPTYCQGKEVPHSYFLLHS